MAEIRRRGGFADRNNLKSINKEIQFNIIYPDTRMVIWNKISKMIETMRHAYQFESYADRLIAEYCCENLFNISRTSSECNYHHVLYLIKDTIDNNEYGDVLDVIEFVCNDLEHYVFKTRQNNNYKRYDFASEMNSCLEEEYVGYRFVNNEIIPITNTEEASSITKALSSPYERVNQSIAKANSYLSNKSRDYENSIKESITAVETLCSILTGKEKATMGQMLNELDKAKQIHPALKEAINKLYGFASDTPGVRHGVEKESMSIDFAEAKFVLVTCSAIINYVIETMK